MAPHLAQSKSYCNDLRSGLQATLKSPHTIHPSLPPPTCATPATLVSLMLLERTKHVPISGLVQLLFLLSIALSSNTLRGLLSQLRWVFAPNYHVSDFFTSSVL